MTLQEYNEMMDLYRKIEKKRQAFLFEKLEEFLSEESEPKDEARIIAYKIFHHAVYWSSNGSSIYYVETKELADKVNDILVDELMDYMLAPPEVYEEDGKWKIDCIFGGNYCLEWEG